VSQGDLEAKMVINAQTKKPSFISHTHPSWVDSSSTTPTHPLKEQRLCPVEMIDYQIHGICYNCDEKYALVHRCKEKKLFFKPIQLIKKLKTIVIVVDKT